jgi:hypothetical protein
MSGHLQIKLGSGLAAPFRKIRVGHSKARDRPASRGQPQGHSRQMRMIIPSPCVEAGRSNTRVKHFVVAISPMKKLLLEGEKAVILWQEALQLRSQTAIYIIPIEAVSPWRVPDLAKFTAALAKCDRKGLWTLPERRLCELRMRTPNLMKWTKIAPLFIQRRQDKT